MKRKKRNLLFLGNFLLLFLCCSVAFAQTTSNTAAKNLVMETSNSSITLKTMRALFPNVPVAVANELHGGLHVVNTVNQLHGVSDPNDPLVLDDNELQVGMLVFVNEKSMYYRYLGKYKNEMNNGTASVDVDPNYWAPLSESINLPEKITVVDNCTKNYVWGTGVDANKLDPTGSSSLVDYSTGNNAGDHLILMPENGKAPIDTYVWNGEKWILISKGTSVYNTSETTNWTIENGDVVYNNQVITNQFVEGDVFQITNEYGNIETYIFNGDEVINILSSDIDVVEVVYGSITDPEANLPKNSSDIEEGAIYKVIITDDGTESGSPTGSYITYACESVDFTKGTGGNADVFVNNWIEVARYLVESDTKTMYKVYYSFNNGSTKEAFNVQNEKSNSIVEAVDLKDFWHKMDMPNNTSLSVTASNANNIILYYPVEWNDFTVSILVNDLKYELSNGVVIETVLAGMSDVYAQGTYYKKLTVFCGEGKTIVID